MNFAASIFFAFLSMVVITKAFLYDAKRCNMRKFCNESEPLGLFCAAGNGPPMRSFLYKCYLDVLKCNFPDRKYKLVSNSQCERYPGLTPCDHVCTREYDPVCTVDKYGEISEFSNQCVFDIEQCKHWTKMYDIVDRKMCKQPKRDPCMHGCPLLRDPVCTESNGHFQEFPNKCVFGIEKCRHPAKIYHIVDRKMCEQPKRDPCMRGCPLIHDPVCTEDNGHFHEFANKCVFGMEKCRHPGKIYHIVDPENCVVKDPCEHPCSPLIDDPVCTEDNGHYKQYPNNCVFGIEQCKHRDKVYHIVSLEKCREERKKCEHRCPLIYEPICTKEVWGFKEYINACYFSIERCKYPDKTFYIEAPENCKKPREILL